MMILRKIANFLFKKIKKGFLKNQRSYVLNGTEILSFPVTFDDQASGRINDIYICPNSVAQKNNLFP